MKREHRNETKPPSRSFGGQMKWSDVVASTGPRPVLKPPLFDWDPQEDSFPQSNCPRTSSVGDPTVCLQEKTTVSFWQHPRVSSTSNPIVKRVEKTPTNI